MDARLLDASLRQTERDLDRIVQTIRSELEKFHDEADLADPGAVPALRETISPRRQKKTLAERLDIRVFFQRLFGVRQAVKAAKELEALRYGPISLQELPGHIVILGERVTTLAGSTEESAWRLANASARIAQLDERVPALSTRIDAIAKDYASELAALRGLIETIARRVDELSKGSASNIGESGTRAFIVDAEERALLSRGDANVRQGGYLSLLKAAVARTGQAKVLGAGSGEFLQILRAIGVNGAPIDILSAGREDGGLAVVETEAGDGRLGRLDANSVAGLCAFQAIRQAPFEDLVAFLTEAYRVLAPGGVLLIEPFGGAQSADPAFGSPQTSEILSLVVRKCGFVDAECIPLHPGGAENYSLIAWKPL
ncbi:MAG: hypothetical protein P4M15_13110 [Alphaproteobacteria bacterium]|nr:hypothetical protein [Alphaproteobacteria bacterium]